MLLPRDFYRILKNLYLCPDRGLLPAFGLQSTPVSNKTRKSTNISNNLQSRVNPNQENTFGVGIGSYLHKCQAKIHSVFA